MDRVEILLLSLVVVAGAIPIAHTWYSSRVWNKTMQSQAREDKLKEVESLIQHVKTMTALKVVAEPKAIVEPPSLEKTAVIPKRRGRPSKAVTTC